MAAPGAFLGGASSRLLPASIPFRYFGAAVAYHLLAWLALLAGAGQFPRFEAGLGWPLAALHLVTLGVLVMAAIGASLQLLPVATRQPVRGVGSAAAIWWLYTPGVAAVALGMGFAAPLLLATGTTAVVLALLIYAALLAGNLRGARGMPGVVTHGWAALGSLLVLLVTAVSLSLFWAGVPLVDRSTALALHVSFASYGFMGLLALGLSGILVPMFALSSAPDERQFIASCALAVAALALAALAAFGVAAQPMRSAAVVFGAAATALHLRLMLGALRSGLRRELGRSFTLVRISWALLAASLAAALGVVPDAPAEGVPTLFGLLLIGGWLLTFLLGILQRILPFLASMYVGRGVREPPRSLRSLPPEGAQSGLGRPGAGLTRPPTPSSMSADRPLAVHFLCHLLALTGLALAVVVDSPLIAALAAAIGAFGAAAFGVFFVTLLRRMRASAPASPGSAIPSA